MPDKKISQISLVAGMLKLLDELSPGISVTQSQYNQVIQCANQLIDAFNVTGQSEALNTTLEN